MVPAAPCCSLEDAYGNWNGTTQIAVSSRSSPIHEANHSCYCVALRRQDTTAFLRTIDIRHKEREGEVPPTNQFSRSMATFSKLLPQTSICSESRTTSQESDVTYELFAVAGSTCFCSLHKAVLTPKTVREASPSDPPQTMPDSPMLS